MHWGQDGDGSAASRSQIPKKTTKKLNKAIPGLAVPALSARKGTPKIKVIMTIRNMAIAVAKRS
ncbi:unnamed protein product [marine sediment metagenome]|uniref:Uncharacterized protein n=1 Tax=marine sediment metagenome TaxID=412755 RepID=X0WBR5_9ZZZZ